MFWISNERIEKLEFELQKIENYNLEARIRQLENHNVIYPEGVERTNEYFFVSATISASLRDVVKKLLEHLGLTFSASPATETSVVITKKKIPEADKKE